MKKEYFVGGMTCSACSLGIERNVKKLDGVNFVSVSLIDKTMSVDFDETLQKEETIIATVEGLGYTVALFDEAKIDRQAEAKALKKRFFLSLIFLVPLMYFSMGGMFSLPVFKPTVNLCVQFILSSIIIGVNYKFFVNGFKAVKSLSPNMDTLVSMGSLSAFVYSVVATVFAFLGKDSHAFYESSAMVLTLVTLGKFLEEKSKTKTGDEIEKLSRLMPKTSTVLRNGKEVTVLTREIEKGESVIVKAGEYVAVDGVIIDGCASVDSSAITGESLPKELNKGESVTSGNIVKNGYLIIKAENVGDNTLFSQIVETVKKAGASKAPVQKFVDKVAGVFVPVVTAIALITFSVWMFINGDLYQSFNYAISVLVISCPCALGLATPVAIVAAFGRGAALGVLFKDALALQKMANVNVVMLDKTATLTEGKPKVTDFMTIKDRQKVLEISFVMETKSSHPLAECVKDFCKENGVTDKVLESLKINGYEYVVGQGVILNVDGQTFYLGNEKLLPKNANNVYKDSKESFGKTSLYLADDSSVIAVFYVADTIKKESPALIKTLTENGIKTVMVTGDNETVAQAVAEETSIYKYIAGVLPNEKAQAVEREKENGSFVAFVGDGINDSPALKSADVGVAMGTGTDIAIDSADVVLVGGNLKSLDDAVFLSKKTQRVIKGNLFWAFFYNVVAIPVAAGVFAFANVTLTPMIASLCMSVSSLFVVLNALRLTRFRKIKKSKGEIKMKQTVKIDGMMCQHCAGRVTELLKNLDGVENVTISLEDKCAYVEGETALNKEQVKSVIDGAGYKFIDLL